MSDGIYIASVVCWMTAGIILALATMLILSMLKVSKKPLPLPRASDAPFEKPLFGLTATPPWSTDERRMFAAFLQSPTGRSLWERARHVEAGMAITACADSITHAHSAGQASGFSECLKWLESLAKDEPISGASAVQGATTTTGNQDGAVPVEFKRSF